MSTWAAPAVTDRRRLKGPQPWVDFPVGGRISREASVRGFIEREFLRSALALVYPVEAGKCKLLELGCGPGHLTEAMARRGFRVNAVDRTEAVVRRARERIGGNATISVAVQHDETGTSCFADSMFDFVVALRLLPWLSDSRALLEEASRVLKPGGMFVLAVRNKNSLRDFIDPATNPLAGPVLSLWLRFLSGMGLRQRFRPGFPKTHSRREVSELLDSHGFEIVEERSTGVGPLMMFGYHLVPDAIGIRIAKFFQWCVARGVPLPKAAAVHTIILATKSKEIIRGGNHENTHK